MAVRELSAMTWEEVAALDTERVVAILPVGATEAHGPHLPVGTDVFIARAMARAGAAALEARGYIALILPAIAYTPAPFADAFAGTIGISEGTLAATIADIALSVGRRGIRVIAVANSHLDPAHLRALGAVAKGGADGAAAIAFPDITRRVLASRLTEEFQSGACHAGQYESSIILAVHPEHVRTDAMSSLPPVQHSLSDAMREGKTTFEEAGGPRAYFGSPALATAEEGWHTIATLGAMLEESAIALMENAS